MANNSKAKAAETVVEAPVVEVKKPAESVYTAAELAEHYREFKTSQAIVVVALRLAGVKTATFAEAKSIIDTFKNKEVK